MSEGTGTSPRVLFLLDSPREAEPLLEAAMRLAVGAPGGILGLFLEDADLLSLAELPFAREVVASALARPLDRRTLEREWTALAAEVREMLARFAESDGLPWSFQVVRGRLAAQLAAAPAEVELAWVRRTRHLSSAGVRPGSRTLLPVITVFESAQRDGRSLLAADDLAWATDSDLLVLLPAAAPTTRSEARRAAQASIRRLEPRQVHFEALDDADATGLAARVNQLGAGNLVLSWSRVQDEQVLETLARLRGALLLVR